MQRSIRLRTLLAAALLLSLGVVPLVSVGEPAAAQQASPVPGGEMPDAFSLLPRRCPMAGPIGETEGESYACGVLIVPENYDDPTGRRIELTYVLLRSTSLSPAADPIVYLEGGPGGNAVDQAAGYAEGFADLRLTRDIILFNQRGTKFSGRLDCTPYHVALNMLIETDPEVAAIFAEAAGEFGEEALSEFQAQTVMTACADGLTADAGVDLTQYHSANSVRDIASLTTALGYKEFNLYGISYGTRLALTMMRDQPDNIRSVVLDSSYPPQINSYENTTNLLEEVVEQLLVDCETDPACQAAYPNLRDQVRAVVEQIGDDDFSLGVLVSVLSRLNTDPRVAAYIPRMIDELSRGSTATLDGIVSGEIFDTAPTETPTLTRAEELLLTAAEIERDARSLLAAAAEEAQAQRPGAIWFGQLVAALDQIPTPATQQEATIGLFILPALTPSPDRNMLAGMVAAFVPSEQQDTLFESLADLPEEEVRFVYDLIATTIDTATGSSLTEGMFFAVECFEEVPFNDLSAGEAAYQALDYPKLGADGLILTSQTFAVCQAYPPSPADAIETAPVRSDVPTLVLAGQYDIQTPPSWGRLAAQELTNVHYVEFPNSGHGVIFFSQCAKDVAEAFLNNPTAAPLATCTSDLKPAFVVEP